MTTTNNGRVIYVHKRTLWVTWVGRTVTTNHNSTNTHGDTTIHFYKNAISGISTPFYCNTVWRWMKKVVESESTLVDGYNIKSRD